MCLLQIQPARSSSRESEYPGLQLDGSLELYFILGMALVCVLVVWEWLKRSWDRLDAWWAGSHASSRRARRLRRMQRAVEDELAAQLQGMSLEDMSSRPQVSPQLTVRGHLCLRSPPTSCLLHHGPRPRSLVAALQCVSSLPKRIVSLPSNQSRESYQIRCLPGSKSARSMNFPKVPSTLLRMGIAFI